MLSESLVSESLRQTVSDVFAAVAPTVSTPFSLDPGPPQSGETTETASCPRTVTVPQTPKGPRYVTTDTKYLRTRIKPQMDGVVRVGVEGLRERDGTKGYGTRGFRLGPAHRPESKSPTFPRRGRREAIHRSC